MSSNSVCRIGSYTERSNELWMSTRCFAYGKQCKNTVCWFIVHWIALLLCQRYALVFPRPVTYSEWNQNCDVLLCFCQTDGEKELACSIFICIELFCLHFRSPSLISLIRAVLDLFLYATLVQSSAIASYASLSGSSCQKYLYKP